MNPENLRDVGPERKRGQPKGGGSDAERAIHRQRVSEHAPEKRQRERAEWVAERQKGGGMGGGEGGMGPEREKDRVRV